MDELEGLVVVSEGEVAEILEVRKTELEAVIKEGEAIHALMVRMEPFLAASRVVIRDEGLEIVTVPFQVRGFQKCQASEPVF